MGAVTDQTPEASASQTQPIELILLRQVASYLDVPIFLVDASGQLLFYNEPAEPLLGVRFEDVGPMTQEEWLAAFLPPDAAGSPTPTDDVPLIRALRTRQPVHSELRFIGRDGVPRTVDVTAMPLRGQAGDLLGAMAFFWHREDA